jgi:hypothetical protein
MVPCWGTCPALAQADKLAVEGESDKVDDKKAENGKDTSEIRTELAPPYTRRTRCVPPSRHRNMLRLNVIRVCSGSQGVRVMTVNYDKCERCGSPLSEAEKERSSKGFQEWVAKTPNAIIISDQYYRGDIPGLGCPIPSYAQLLCDPCRLKAYEWEIKAEEWARSRPLHERMVEALANPRGWPVLFFIIMITGSTLAMAAQAIR